MNSQTEQTVERIRLAMDATPDADLVSLASTLWAYREAYDGLVDELGGILGVTRADLLVPAVQKLREERDEARAECERIKWASKDR